ncbi:ADP-ribosylglycohydrolase family protein [Limihaloglobus sulfuriphilus]|uniref:ADP-ribosylglycohydrolase family protein n=1 Tax=Limihaloglobus sulfuriphilus TaxID=1851148 RepID=UPI0011BAA43F|nr:ADP-ribosylglycohydrolase family protein [Limihaloglobus sulfuriphilus]
MQEHARYWDQNFPSTDYTKDNAVMVVFGLAIGGTVFSKVIPQNVSMALDNDYTAATAGSIVGAIVGKDGISSHWSEPFNN